MSNNSAQAAAGRLFRVYERHCQNPSPDTLFEALTAIHSLNDRLKKATGRDLHEIEEFIALKVLRNFAHHEEEVHANVRVIPVPAYSDLLFMCIVQILIQKVCRFLCVCVCVVITHGSLVETQSRPHNKQY